ncbi:uncharacterized protein LOC129757093 isoform X2 [Uranotaenia lowii]|uniref:uncharacterized protein LOC129757093 isoform X2 n=1 Tax=Uranotaenia lowii TaxID=190385 RepID=UPI002479B2E1|nr:uncharacterized protein LOC129757093 isoform X2 [Uranotaenia lowii]
MQFDEAEQNPPSVQECEPMSEECESSTPKAANVAPNSANVRSRVRYWLNDIVDEMRKKSPASVQKWVDSIQIPPAESTGVDQMEAGPSCPIQIAVPAVDPTSQPSNPDALLMEPIPTTLVGVSDESGSEMEADALPHVLTTIEPPLISAGPSCCSEEEKSIAGPLTTPLDGKSDSGSSISIKSLLSKKNLLEKFSRSSSNLEQENLSVGEQDLYVTPDEEPRKSNSIASIGKIKINEFYDKLSMNKAKYSLIKSKKIDIRNMFGTSKENLDQKLQPSQSEVDKAVAVSLAVSVAEDSETRPSTHTESGEEDVDPKVIEPECAKLSMSDIYEFSFDESFPKDDDIPDVSEEDDEKENLEVPPQAYGTYLNPAKTYHRMGIGKIGRSSSENPRANNKRYNLLEIGRSFSEMNDDDQFVISECNNSCPNPSSLNTSSSINNSNSNMLACSVPVSPIPRTSSKLSIQQDNSLSESPRRRSTMLMKDSSLQSDSSRCSSVESLLNARKPDPERILLNLGFGPAAHNTDVLSRIPKRFLKPSQVRGVDTEAFLRQQHLSMHIHENSVLGYRGLVGKCNPFFSNLRLL